LPNMMLFLPKPKRMFRALVFCIYAMLVRQSLSVGGRYLFSVVP